MKIFKLIILAFALFIMPLKAYALCESCDNENFLNVLSQLESGHGGYTTQSAVITDPASSHTGATAMGKWQIMHREAVAWGCIPTRNPSEASGAVDYVLTSAEVQTFLNDPAAQDACKVTGLEEKYRMLVNYGYENGAGGYDCGALLGAAWLGDPKSVVNGTCTGDSINKSYTTCTRAGQMQGVCTGGGAIPTNIPYPGRAAVLLGCDREVLAHNRAIVDGFRQAEIDTASEIIKQPLSAEAATCGDQTIKGYNTLTATFSNPGNIAPGALNTNCTPPQDLWNMDDCASISIPNFSSIINNKIAQATGAITNALNLDRLKDKVCRAAASSISELTGASSSKYDAAANAMISPIIDTFQGISKSQDKAVGNIIGQ